MQPAGVLRRAVQVAAHAHHSEGGGVWGDVGDRASVRDGTCTCNEREAESYSKWGWRVEAP